jgi:hypothetical protein
MIGEIFSYKQSNSQSILVNFFLFQKGIEMGSDNVHSGFLTKWWTAAILDFRIISVCEGDG